MKKDEKVASLIEPSITIREFVYDETHGSDYHKALELRTKVLREPLGLTFDPVDLAKEFSDVHVGAFEGSQVLGCLILTRLNELAVKMRQVAVDPSLQRRKIGRLLVEKSEQIARSKGFKQMVLSARETAVPFYLALGYAVEGEPFKEVGIPHRKMSRVL